MQDDELKRRRADLLTASELTKALLQEPEISAERRMALELRLARVQAEIKRLGASAVRHLAAMMAALALS